MCWDFLPNETLENQTVRVREENYLSGIRRFELSRALDPDAPEGNWLLPATK
jgi:hypothetical protein